MSRILTANAAVADEPCVIAPPSRDLDDATRQLLERERDRAYARGREDGAREAVERARAEAAALGSALDRATEQVVATVRAQHEQLAAGLADRVVAAVAAVIGREPGYDGRALVARLVAAIDALDDPGLVVRVAPARLEIVRTALSQRPAITVEVDDSLAVDDAVVTGQFAHADLRVAALLGALDEVLTVDGALPPGSSASEDEVGS